LEIKGKNILILGGWGMVGTAICRQLFIKKPASITIASLLKVEADSACQELEKYAGDVKLIPAWGNIFVREELKDLTREQILDNREHRLMMAEDVLERTTETSFQKFYLHQLIAESKPNIILDCINTATGVAYQDIYSVGLRVLKGMKDVESCVPGSELGVEVEKLLTSLYLPQLVRHIQVLYHAMKVVNTQSYVKIGTSGTGGMGLNIPYTHSEDKPSRILLSKSSVAGAHSLLLFLMARTPDAPYVKEVKPAAAIAWKAIRYGDVQKHGKPIELYDCKPEDAMKLQGEFNTRGYDKAKLIGAKLQGAYIDTGENGTFSLGEFTAITTSQQMEFITPEEIAQTVLWEVEGGATGKDIIAALDASVLTSTYRSGIMRNLAIDKMRKLINKNSDGSIAFELLGPPRLSKLLFEANLLKRIASSINGVMAISPKVLSSKIAELISNDTKLRSQIISIGIPILLPDGRSLLRGPFVKVPQDPRQEIFDATSDSIDQWSQSGWVDCRVSNMEKWHNRFRDLIERTESSFDDDSSSYKLRDEAFWHCDDPLDEGEIVGWLFIHEDDGLRMK